MRHHPYRGIDDVINHTSSSVVIRRLSLPTYSISADRYDMLGGYNVKLTWHIGLEGDTRNFAGR